MLSTTPAFLVDMDGVLYHGDRALAHAAQFMAGIVHCPRLYVTNNSSITPEAVVAKLRGLGIPVSGSEQVLTSAQATAQYLHGLRPGFHYYAVGGPGLHQALEPLGEPDARRAEFVVIGEGPGLDFQTLTTGVNLVLAGARLIGTNPDPNVDAVLDGRPAVLPGGGALLSPFQVASGATPTIIGKPGPLLYQQAMQRLGVEPGRCWMVGDRPDTDIRGAAALGMRTLLVRTGRFRPGDPYPEDVPAPDLSVDSLAEVSIPELLRP